ncbi:MAG TPA: hypothetical protein VGV15_12095 [Terriglobales bacterium]|nr:hypothetical protein [Terriglobales bacterium]
MRPARSEPEVAADFLCRFADPVDQGSDLSQVGYKGLHLLAARFVVNGSQD